MTDVIQAQVAIPRDTGLPEDVTVNTFHFRNDAVSDTVAIAEIQARIENFYNTPAAGETFAVHEALSVLNGNPVIVKYYDARAEDTGGPLEVNEFTLDGPGAGLLPEECALALSYRALPVAGVPAARLRGRIFLGPLSEDIITITAGRVHVEPDVLAAITASAKQFLMDDDDVAPWVVNSRGIGTRTVAANRGRPFTDPTKGTADWEPFESEITVVWADDALDTIRSRGTDPLTRATRLKA